MEFLPSSRRHGFKLAIICALPLEADAVEALFDHVDDDEMQCEGALNDPNAYTTGSIGCHKVVLVHMPGMGKVNAATVAASCLASFSNIKLALVVGICGAAPLHPENDQEIILGDVIVSDGIIQYDLGRQLPENFVRKDTLLDSLGRPNMEIRSLLKKLRGISMQEKLKVRMMNHLHQLIQKPTLQATYLGTTQDFLFQPNYRHINDGKACHECGCNGELIIRRRLSREVPQPEIHFGLFASGDTVMKSGQHRDDISRKANVVGFEMEGAGVWDTIPCIVIKGVCDYADSHKTKGWQRYAAATSAACAKAFLQSWVPPGTSDHTNYTSIQEDLKSVLARVDDREQQEILEWISPIKYGSHHNATTQDRTANTCEWLLEHESFQEWINSDSSMILWLRGHPGTGKTFLTSKVIDHIQNRLESQSNPEGFAYFYCNKNEEDRRKPLSILRSYVRQLSTTIQSPERIQEQLRQLWIKEKRNGSDLSLGTCRDQLLKSVNLYSETTLVLDALDECDPLVRWQFVKAIEELLSKSIRPLKIFISSRPDDDIKRGFSSRPNIEIQATDNQSDIEMFIREEIDKPRRWGAISTPLRNDIIKTLLRDSQGMFQWAFLQIRQVLEIQTEKGIRKKLGKLPAGLKSTYDEIYDQISRDENAKDLVDFASMWVLCASRPLESSELLSIVHLDAVQDDIDSESGLDESSLLAYCNHLLVVDSQLKVWRFSHLSVAEYMESRLDLLHAHCHTTTVCLKLMINLHQISAHQLDYRNLTDDTRSLEDYDTSESLTTGFQHPFQPYLKWHWADHVKKYDEYIYNKQLVPDHCLVGLLKSFLGSPENSSKEYDNWRKSVSYYTSYTSHLSLVGRFLLDRDSSSSTPMFMSSLFSFNIVLKDWWDNAEIDESQENTWGENLLLAAVIGGCKSICEILIRRGMRVNHLVSGRNSNALTAAVCSQNLEMIRFLIEKGANINLLLISGDYGSALAAAAYEGNTEIIQLLIEKGANVNLLLISGDYGSALAATAAIYRGNTKIIQLLIEKGADINLLLTSGCYGSALAAAAAPAATGYKQKTEIIQLPVEKGAGIDLLHTRGHYGSAPAVAAYRGSTEIVQLLIEEGANINLLLTRGHYGSALAAAAYNGNTKTIQLLIKKGADVNLLLISGYYGSALAAAAAYRGNTKIVQLLIKEGANINLLLISGYYGSALAAAAATAAAYRGNTETVQLLIEKGANINLLLTSGYYGSALAAAAAAAAAAYGGNTETVQLLIEEGANINLLLTRRRYGSALAAAAAAAYGGNTETVQLLIEKGADIGVVSERDGYSPLHYGSISENVKVLEVLLATPGIDVNKTDSHGRTALFRASQKGNKQMVQALLSKGKADPNLKDWYGSTPLFTAVRNCHCDVARLLLAAPGIDLEIKDGFDRSLIWWARKAGNPQLLELLEQHGQKLDCFPDTDASPYNEPQSSSDSSKYFCYACTLDILYQRGYYFCNECDGGDLCLCAWCVDQGIRCRDESHSLHFLVKRKT